MRAATLFALAAGIPLNAAITGHAQQTTAQRPTVPGDSLPPEIFNDPLHYYRKATFKNYLNTKFRPQAKNTRGFVLILIQVKTVGPLPDRPKPGQECFSLLFRSANRMRQGSYKLKHDSLGLFDLFIVPVGQDAKGRYYEAIINRLNP